MQRPISISLNSEIVDEIEEKRGAISRSKFIELLIARALYSKKREAEVETYYA